MHEFTAPAMRRAAVALVVLAASACRGKSGPATTPRAPLAPVEFAGCAAVDEGPVCAIGSSRSVRVLLPANARDVVVSGGTSTPLDGGVAGSIVVRVDDGATSIRIEATTETRAEWSLRVANAPEPPTVITESRALREAGKIDEAAHLLEAAAGDDPRIASAMARIAIVRGDLDAAAHTLATSADRHAARGHLSAAADDAFARAFVLQEQRHFADARTSIARGAAWSVDYYEGRTLAVLHEGALARETGDQKTALRRLADATSRAQRASLTSLANSAAMDHAIALSEAGLSDAALEELARIDGASDVSPCLHADVWLNIGWIRLTTNDDEGAPNADAADPIRKALATATGTCRDPRREVNLRTNLAWAHLQRGALDDARAELARARSVMRAAPELVAAFWIDLDAQIALAGRDPKSALASYDKLAENARRTGAINRAWRAADGRAAALSAMGRTRDALVAAEDAERLIDQESHGVPIDEGRASFLGARERTARRRVTLLLDAGRSDRAIAAARLAHARGLADLERRDRVAALDEAGRARWESALAKYHEARATLALDTEADATRSTEGRARAADVRAAHERDVRAALDEIANALPPAKPALARPAAGSGERVVVYFPLLTGWVAFVDDGEHVVATRLGAIDTKASIEALGRALVEPLRAALNGATRIRVVAHGALADVDVHALPIDGQPLVARAPLDFAIDLGASSPARGSDRAVVFADPTSDLPATRHEARVALAALDGHGRSHVTLIEGAAATRAAFVSALGDADFVHYAGHGVFAGVEGWSSELALADGGSLSIGDVLALPRVPREVVLSGCETARSAGGGRAASIGIAHAFLIAGSDVVIGATRSVRDGDTRDFMAALYEALAADPKRDVVAALRRAQMMLASGGGVVDWSAFRALRR